MKQSITTEQLKELLDKLRYGKPTCSDEAVMECAKCSRRIERRKQALSIINQHVAEVIGEDETPSGMDGEEDYAISWVNGEKEEQRKRAGL